MFINITVLVDSFSEEAFLVFFTTKASVVGLYNRVPGRGGIVCDLTLFIVVCLKTYYNTTYVASRVCRVSILEERQNSIVEDVDHCDKNINNVSYIYIFITHPGNCQTFD